MPKNDNVPSDQPESLRREQLHSIGLSYEDVKAFEMLTGNSLSSLEYVKEYQAMVRLLHNYGFIFNLSTRAFLQAMTNHVAHEQKRNLSLLNKEYIPTRTLLEIVVYNEAKRQEYLLHRMEIDPIKKRLQIKHLEKLVKNRCRQMWKELKK